MSTDVHEFLTDLDGGNVERKLSAILSQVAGAVVDHGRAGKVTLELNVKQIGSGHQVTVGTKFKFNCPTTRGSQSEEETTQTPMHVGRGGAMSFFPEDQGQMFDKKGRIPAQQER